MPCAQYVGGDLFTDFSFPLPGYASSEGVCRSVFQPGYPVGGMVWCVSDLYQPVVVTWRTNGSQTPYPDPSGASWDNQSEELNPGRFFSAAVFPDLFLVV